MSQDGERSVTRWLSDLKEGQRDEASRQLWERYFARLVRLAHAHLQRARYADGEDVALSAFDTLFRGVEEGRYPKLDDRHDLWKLLTTIVVRKASNQRRREGQLKRGGGKVARASELAAGAASDPLAELAGSEPTPEFAAAWVEEVRQRFADLRVESLRVVALLRMEGFAIEEIAKSLDCAPRSVQRKLNSIRDIWADEATP
jgi:DNA-directed RNA polymerase specialized sigma24 family protein